MRRFLPLLILLISSPVFATTYTVKTSGGDYATLQACHDVTVAGDICSVYAGTYPKVSITRSGTVGNPITYIAAEAGAIVSSSVNSSSSIIITADYITIDGLEVTATGTSCPGIRASTGADNVIIQNNNVHDTTSYGVYLFECTNVTVLNNTIDDTNPENIRLTSASNCLIQGNTITDAGNGVAASGCIRFFQTANSSTDTTSSYIRIKNNMISRCGIGQGAAAGIGIQAYGNYNLIEGNDISHTSDLTRVFGQYNVLRNNSFHDSTNADAGQPEGTTQSSLTPVIPQPP